MSNLIHRPRRLRRTEALRSMVREVRLAPENFILPLFVCPGEHVRHEISSMPGVHNLSVDEILKEATGAFEAGVRGIILFGLPETKDALASGAYAEDGVVQKAIRAIRRSVPDLIIMADTCLCEYTAHGHCGVVRNEEVLNDESLELLARTAVSQAEAGADIVAPYAMIKAAAQKGWIDEQRVMMETLTSIKRAGADVILTYYAREAVRLLK